MRASRRAPIFRSTAACIWAESRCELPSHRDGTIVRGLTPLRRRIRRCAPVTPRQDPSKMASARLIKKYPNRRLYDTQTSTYITLSDVKQLVLENEEFKVLDAKTNEDLTRSILLQIILEEEGGGLPMFSSPMLSQIIRFYGHAMQGMMGTYLEKNIQAFIDIQAKLADQSKNLYEGKAMNP